MDHYKFDKALVPNWDKFTQLASDFEYTLRETGGLMFTHEIDCSRTDFNSLVQLSK
jgi:hypothetical protein